MRPKHWIILAGGLALSAFLAGCPGNNSPEAPPTSPAPPAPTSTTTFTPTVTGTLPPTNTPTLTPTDSMTPSPTFSATASLTATPTVSPTDTSTFTITFTPTRTRTNTRTFTYTRTPTGSWTYTPTATPTDTPTATETPTPWHGIGTGLRGDYYNGEAFDSSVLTRVDPRIQFEMAGGSPDPLVNADHFSVKWTGEVLAPYSGPITFLTASDEGVRLWVNGLLLIDHYSPHTYTIDYGPITLTAGQKYPIELDYYETTGQAVIDLGWWNEYLPQVFIETEFLYPATSSPPTSTPTFTPTMSLGTGTGLKGEYFNGMAFDTLVLTRQDAQVDLDFGTGSPDASINTDAFSARWTGEVQAPFSGPIEFYTQSDDGVRLWVNGTLLIDNWTSHPPTFDYGTITLTAGQKYPIQLDYYEDTGGALISLGWQKSGVLSAQPIPASNLFPAPGIPTATPTFTFTMTPTFTDTLTPTPTRTFTNSPTIPPTPSFTPTHTPTFTPSFTPTPTVTFTFTQTPTPTITHTPTHTGTNTRTFTPTATRTPCSSSVTFGITSPGAPSPDNFPNYTTVFYSNFTANSTGILSKVGIWLATFPANYQMAVYTVDGSGYAVTPVSVSDIQLQDTGGPYQWVYFNMPPAAITNGTTYAFLIWFQSGNPPTVPRLNGAPGTYKAASLSGSDLSSAPNFLYSQPYLLNIQAVVCP